MAPINSMAEVINGFHWGEISLTEISGVTKLYTVVKVYARRNSQKVAAAMSFRGYDKPKTNGSG